MKSLHIPASLLFLLFGVVAVSTPATAASPPPTPSIISQCQSGQFCMWTDSNYSGSFTYVTGSGVTKTIGHLVNSVWNNRTKAARLYNNTGTSYTCLAAGAKKSVLATSYQRPAKVYLASGTTC